MGEEIFSFKVPAELVKRAYFENTNVQYRTEFMRDRDRVLYSTAFRRLAGKTQIYTIGIDDHKRNRLTHTLEVSQIARTIAHALNLDCDLTEAIALAHDLGHTPFGHAGERMLHDIMCPNSDIIKNSPLKGVSSKKLKNIFEREVKLETKDSLTHMFGFKHNIQSVRVAVVLEDTYRDDKGKNIGLNLTNYTLWGIINHSKRKYENDDPYPDYQEDLKPLFSLSDNEEAWSFEAYVVEMADDIAQWHHDLEDALRGHAMTQKNILKSIKDALQPSFSIEDKKLFEKMASREILDRKFISDISHIVVNTLVSDLIKNSKEQLDKLHKEMQKKSVGSIEIFKHYNSYEFSMKKEDVISFSEEIQSFVLKNEIKTNVHHSRDVERMNEKGKYIIRKLFEAYYSHPQQLPDGPIMHFMVEVGGYSNIDEAKQAGVGKIRTEFDEELKNMTLIKKLILMRRVCDHIASMTDGYAINEYNHLYG